MVKLKSEKPIDSFILVCSRIRWQGLVNKILSTILIVAVLTSMGALVYVISKPNIEEFTEFYILDLKGEAIHYPLELRISELGRVIVGIVNREQTTVSYRVGIRIGEVQNFKVDTITLEYGEKWEEIMNFRPATVGDTQKVEFLLYKNDESEPYLKLHLWISVKE
ncbi:DUF1616 domain-containing protein [Chloroflexota bacterium]